MYASQESVLVIGLIALIALGLAIHAVSKLGGFGGWKYRKRSKYQRHIDKYFEAMRYYNFKDEDIIDMLWDNNPGGYKEMMQAIENAKKERTGKI